MARPQTDLEAGREQLLDITVGLIEERGTAALTVTDIAARAGMSPASLYRYFDSKEAVIEAVAERWFQPLLAMAEDVLASDLPPRRKMFEFYARRFAYLRATWERDPVAFTTYCELGEEHFELIRSYVDLGDHYLATIIGEAMADGYFAGLELDESISLVNQMTATYCTIGAMQPIMPKLSEEKLARIIDAVFDGLSATDRGARSVTGLRAA
ncbi:TetR/AcrR family transcriptional regulator [Novosphingobium sp.]|jgi:AcrR family transcriptional regulator|uniref:TetR/AcrR family transcriptional regulator n=1 Tax=Novosphingobium sp. TaxID=1874826 RepID=UPI001EB64E9E|nr:TetR/AcrR family transcriptional regulator [Novosphingobium sp.]MBK6800062.1 TetR family transcriptional regulator [Novosphingobium sp.]MBK9010922.1 TetR family transcriptional regulator [Novosphingobium sp.]